MNRIVLASILLLLASLLTTPVHAEPADSLPFCELVGITPFFPFVTVDPNCLPVGPSAPTVG